MDNKEDIYQLFPAILKNKLVNNELCFPNGTKYNYEKIFAYRCIERKKENKESVNRSDFYSNIEDSIINDKPIKKKRGQSIEPKDDIRYYATSLYKDRNIIDNIMYLPRPSKKVCSGYVFMEGGPQITEDQHINWWMFEQVDLTQFTIEEDVCENKNIESINLEDLPLKNSYFKVVSKSHNDFLNELEEILSYQTDGFKMIDVEIHSNELKEFSFFNLNRCFNKDIDIKETKILGGLKLDNINKFVSSYDKEFENILTKNAVNTEYIKYKVELKCGNILLVA